MRKLPAALGFILLCLGLGSGLGLGLGMGSISACNACEANLSIEAKTDTTLLIVGTFNIKNNLIHGIGVNLYCEGRKIDSLIVTGNQEFGFYLQRNRIYTLEIIKEGYGKKIVGISTKLPDYVEVKHFFNFGFSIPLEKKQRHNSKVDDDEFEFPTAVILYNEVLGKFDYSLDSSRFMKEKHKAK